MIKRITFGTFDVRDEAAVACWRSTLAGAADAPDDVRPARVTCCVSLPDEIVDQPHDGIGLEWFADADHLGRFEAWSASEAARGRLVPADTAAFVVVADEHIARGAGWLEQRWATGGESLKHMAVARRAAGLTPAEFSSRWQDRAGVVGTTPIPDEAKGCAYVQNHPLARETGDWRYDAINEVWFDDIGALRSRIRWLTDALATGADDDFVGESAFMAVREEVVLS
jgi:hypothetical protein